MNISKFVNPLTISAVGFVLTVLAGVLIYVLLIQKTLADVNMQTGIYQQNVGAESPQAKAAAEAAVTQAQVNVAAVQAQWTAIQIAKDPDIDYSDRMLAWNQYINELDFKLAPSIEQWLPSTGVKPTAPITTPAAPADPNAVVANNPIVIPLDGGSPISVVGSFPQILRHVEQWNNFNRIVLIDKLTLAGISPYLIGTYTATVYEFPRNADKIGAAVPSTAGAVAAPAQRPGAR
jgi:hypothetical protein